MATLLVRSVLIVMVTASPGGSTASLGGHGGSTGGAGCGRCGGGGSLGGGSRRGEARRHARLSVHCSESSESESAPELVSLSSTATRRAKIEATSRKAGTPRRVSYRPVDSSPRFSTFRSFMPGTNKKETFHVCFKGICISNWKRNVNGLNTVADSLEQIGARVGLRVGLRARRLERRGSAQQSAGRWRSRAIVLGWRGRWFQWGRGRRRGCGRGRRRHHRVRLLRRHHTCNRFVLVLESE